MDQSCAHTCGQEEAMMAAKCGHSFSKASITMWLRQNHSSCPVCKASLHENQLVPNYALRSAIERYASHMKTDRPEGSLHLCCGQL